MAKIFVAGGGGLPTPSLCVVVDLLFLRGGGNLLLPEHDQ